MLNVLYEDNHLVVVDKPVVLATMGATENQDSLVKQVKHYLRERYNKPGNVYLGVVSRLDSFVSGVIVFARTSKAASRLTDQFRRRIPEKTYLAIVPNESDFPDSGTLRHQIVKNESEHRMMAVSGKNLETQGAKSAVLSYRTVGRVSNVCLLEIQLETGRKHQIRVQLSAAGVPIVGDRKYDSDRRFPAGIALHALRLKLQHPTTRQLLEFATPPPAYWNLSRFGYDVDEAF